MDGFGDFFEVDWRVFWELELEYIFSSSFCLGVFLGSRSFSFFAWTRPPTHTHTLYHVHRLGLGKHRESKAFLLLFFFFNLYYFI